jgi:NAD(P)-dependent dehydrogenase (short-subunit alcohol dehydrogenase family)
MSKPKRRFEGKTAIVTGGASGIGAALSRALAGEGARVVLADRQTDLAEHVAEGLVRAGADAVSAKLDVRDPAAVKALVRDTVSRTGRLDCFFNNAGIGVAGEMDNYEQRDWDDVIDVNLKGVTHGVQAAYPVMVAQRSGHIVNTASMAGLVASAGEGSYAATKHAVVGLSKALRIEAKRHGVRVSVLCPGPIATPILSGGRYGRVNFVGIDETIARELWAPTRPMDPDRFARAALDAIVANEAIIILPRWWTALWYLERISPTASARVWEAAVNKLRRDLEQRGCRATTPGERDAAPGEPAS